MIYLFNISLFDIIDMIIEYINDISLKKKKSWIKAAEKEYLFPVTSAAKQLRAQLPAFKDH